MRSHAMQIPRYRFRILLLLCAALLLGLDAASAQIRMSASVQKDQNVGFYYIRLIFYSATNLTALQGSGIAAAQYDSVYQANQKDVSDFFTLYQSQLGDPTKFTIVDSTGGTGSPSQTERVKILTLTKTFFKAAGAGAHPAEAVVFLWGVLDQDESYQVTFTPATGVSITSDNRITLDDASFFSPAEAQRPFTFDIQPLSDSSTNVDIRYRLGLTDIGSTSGWMQLLAEAEGKRLNTRLSDSLMSVSGSLATRLHLSGFGPVRSSSVTLSGVTLATNGFDDYNIGAVLTGGLLLGLVPRVEGISVELSGEYWFVKGDNPDTSTTTARLSLGGSWQPSFGRYGLDLSIQGWSNDLKFDKAHLNYYYRLLATYEIIPQITAFIGLNQGALPPAFVFDKQFDAGIRFKLDNIPTGD